MKRKAHESNIPPNPAPRIEFMILRLRGWKGWGLGLGFLGLSLGKRIQNKKTYFLRIRKISNNSKDSSFQCVL